VGGPRNGYIRGLNDKDESLPKNDGGCRAAANEVAMNKVLVTGGGGFIGRPLVRALLDRGCAVTVVGRSSYPELEGWGARCLRVDIRDGDRLVRACTGCDTVFHVAAKAGIWGSRDEYFSINYQGSVNVLAACRAAGVTRLIYTSTPSVVFDQCDLEGVDEQTPYASRPLCWYAASKIEAEREVLAANSETLRTIALRPHLVWGPGDRQLIPRLLARGRAGALKMVGDGTNRVDITYIDNAVHAHLLAADHLVAAGAGAGRAFFIGQEKPVALWPWINGLFARMDIPPVRGRVAFSVAYGLGAVLEAICGALRREHEPPMTRFLAHQLARSHWFSHRAAETVLGYRPLVGLEEGLDRLVHWLREKEKCSGSGGSGEEN
jgi:nucleoside-diphosphate-sugar epimerase